MLHKFSFCHYLLSKTLLGCLLFPSVHNAAFCSPGQIQIYGSPCPAYCIIHQWGIIPRRAYQIGSEKFIPIVLAKSLCECPTANVNKIALPQNPPMLRAPAKTAPPFGRAALFVVKNIIPPRPANCSIIPNPIIFSNRSVY